MKTKAVIFDMDGLLIDSEPLWQEAGIEALLPHNIQLTVEQYHSSTGLRTLEWVDHWFTHFAVDKSNAAATVTRIEASAIDKINRLGKPMPGVEHIINFFLERNFAIGIASSSPLALIDVVIKKLGITQHLDAISSAQGLPFGKPHPQVYLNCAETLGIPAYRCICFEDSFNGMIAAKAAKMACVVVPEAAQYHSPRWGAADLKLGSLANFNQLLLDRFLQ
ncbi:hexitol phosphatase HxpB [Flavihumibacter petaseus]|uniref:Putative phosphatase n=1 Tax=Flavihumibacter petaseus NBRC 106054 TaxID=1220578 RepID=A0A0E9MZY5_9BACT|nr:hexitol phosphatase HxpB [Flavihumibacter petaseus]GAO42936.1 putative phosphatase [Flavihumibacter petaseus NBRC 106054]